MAADKTKIRFNSETLSQISEEFIATRKDLSEVEVVVDKVNDIDPLIIIRAVNSSTTPDVATLCDIAEKLFDGSTIEFYHGENRIKGFVYAKGNGNRLTLLFKDESYLLDKLLDVTYAILLKKSTPQ